MWNVSHVQRNDAGKTVNRISLLREELVIISDSHPATTKTEQGEEVYQNIQKRIVITKRENGVESRLSSSRIADCD